MNKKNYNIYLFRHGKTDYNAKGWFTGWKNSILNREGIKNAKKIAEKLRNKPIDVAIYTRLGRSKKTLKYVLKYHPECKKKIKDDRIIERNYGILNGISHEKFKKFFGKKEYDKVHRGWNTIVPEGESFAQVEIRVKDFIKWLKRYIKKNKVNIAISGHGNSIRLFRKVWENKTQKQAEKWFIPYDKVYHYKIKA